MFAGDRQRTAGHYTDAMVSYRDAMSAASDDRQRAITVNNLAGLNLELGEREQARKLYRQALYTWQRILPRDAPELATTLNNLGALYALDRRYRDARRLAPPVAARVDRSDPGAARPTAECLATTAPRTPDKECVRIGHASLSQR